MATRKIYQEERLLTKYCMAKHLRLLVIQSLISYLEMIYKLHQWSTNSFIKNLKNHFSYSGKKIKKQPISYTGPTLENLKVSLYNHHFDITLRVLIFQIFKYWAKYNKRTRFCCVLLLFTATCRTKKILQLLMHFKTWVEQSSEFYNRSSLNRGFMLYVAWLQWNWKIFNINGQ